LNLLERIWWCPDTKPDERQLSAILLRLIFLMFLFSVDLARLGGEVEAVRRESRLSAHVAVALYQVRDTGA
jgi:hypothetical protein